MSHAGVHCSSRRPKVGSLVLLLLLLELLLELLLLLEVGLMVVGGRGGVDTCFRGRLLLLLVVPGPVVVGMVVL